MAALESNGFPFWAQPARLRFISIARSVPRRVAHPPPYFRPTESVRPTASALDCIEDVCLGAPINLRTCGYLAAERTFGHGESTSI
jgi:hypothetical protein